MVKILDFNNYFSNVVKFFLALNQIIFFKKKKKNLDERSLQDLLNYGKLLKFENQIHIL